jgi:stearoyl-CoA desaturase (Delta-9 desaturase)
MPETTSRLKDSFRLVSLPFWIVHVVAIAGVIVTGWSWSGFALALALYGVRMFAVTAGYHRYFSHRTYKMGRVMQFLMALVGTLAVQKGVLWWAAHHRRHHKHSDEENDVHSAKLRGIYWAHVGWILSDQNDETDWARIKDFAKYPELVWLNQHFILPVVVMGAVLVAAGGWWALLWGLFVSTTLLWHGTFTINSLAHLIGKRRYETSDDSRNHWLLAVLTGGEGWHNNHHYYQRSTNQGFYWWEIDVTYYVLRVMQWMRLVSDIHVTPKHVRDRHLTDADPLPEPAAETARSAI